jgi:hypothetical protein
MTTEQQQLQSLRSAIDRIEELAGKIKEALAADDAAEVEVCLAELAQTAGAVNETLAGLAPEDETEQPGD